MHIYIYIYTYIYICVCVFRNNHSMEACLLLAEVLKGHKMV